MLQNNNISRTVKPYQFPCLHTTESHVTEGELGEYAGRVDLQQSYYRPIPSPGNTSETINVVSVKF
jgi:hypothetical protein